MLICNSPACHAILDSPTFTGGLVSRRHFVQLLDPISRAIDAAGLHVSDQRLTRALTRWRLPSPTVPTDLPVKSSYWHFAVLRIFVNVVVDAIKFPQISAGDIISQPPTYCLHENVTISSWIHHRPFVHGRCLVHECMPRGINQNQNQNVNV